MFFMFLLAYLDVSTPCTRVRVALAIRASSLHFGQVVSVPQERSGKIADNEFPSRVRQLAANIVEMRNRDRPRQLLV